MKVANISTIKNELSRYLEYVKRGGAVRILDRHQPVADLVPVGRAGESVSSHQELLSALEQRGVLRRGRTKLDKELFVAPEATGSRGGTGVLESLLDERKSGR